MALGLPGDIVRRSVVCGDLWLLPSLVNIGDTGTRERAPTSLSVCLSVCLGYTPDRRLPAEPACGCI